MDALLKRPPPEVRAVLIYGPDGGLVRERARVLIGSVAGDINDPFRVVELSPAGLADRPGALWEEAAAIAMGGGRRAIRVRGAGDVLAKTFESFLGEVVGDAVVVLEADELGPRSSLRRLFEGADNAAAVPCYLDDKEVVRALLVEALDKAEIAYDHEAIDYAVARLGGDRQVTRREIEKLVAFVGSGGSASLDDVRATIEDSGAASLDALAMAAFAGDQIGADQAGRRCFSEGATPIGVLRALSSHLDKLLRVRIAVDRGGSMEQAIGGLRPPVFFKHRPAFERQTKLWSAERLTQALGIIVESELACKSAGAPDYAVVQRTVMRLAAAAGAAARG